MNKLLLLCLVLFTLSTCQSDKQMNDSDIYIYLQSCYEDYFDNYNLDVTSILNEFEGQLINEGRLSDTTGAAYKLLLRSLDTTNYFTPPLHTKDFNKILLYKNPKDILKCASNVFSIDSTKVANTHFAKVENEIHEILTDEKDVSIHYFFDIYKTKLSKDEIRKPYIKQNILMLLYRWYYISQKKIDSEAEDSLKK